MGSILFAFDVHFILQKLPILLRGAWVTVQISAIGIAGGLAGGLVIAILRMTGSRIINGVSVVFIEFIRATPLIVQVFFLYFGLPTIHVLIPGYTIACVSLVTWCAAYSAENLRAGFEAVPEAYHEGARALGMSRLQILTRVVTPVGFRIAFPALANTAILVIKNSSYMTLIAVPELTYTGINMVATTFRVFEVFTAIGVIYLVLVGICSAALAIAERKLAIAMRT